MVERESPVEYQKVPIKETINEEEVKIPAFYGYGIRHVQSLLLFSCICVGFMSRAHLGVSVVAMTTVHTNNSYAIQNETNNFNSSYRGNAIINATDDEKENAINKEDSNRTNKIGFEVEKNHTEFEDDKRENRSLWNVYRTYEWTKSTQEMILSAFFLGYSVLMFPMGMFCQRFGGKIPLQICLLVNGLVTLITPTVAVWGGWKAVSCCRILQGMSQAGLYPSIHTMLAKWVPISERATFSSYVYTGTTVGTVISFQVGGLFAYSSAGWPATFWLIGSICIVMFVVLTVLAAASPADHKTISEEEKYFILGRIDDGVKKRSKTPWKQIFSSKPVWAAVTTHVFCGMCFVFLFTQIPTYMHYILGFDIKNSGLLSSLPYIASFFFSIIFGLTSDYCTNRGIVTLRTARIVSNSLAQAGPAVCLVAVSFTDNSTIAVILLVMAVGLYSGVHTGWMVNYIDISPNFSGSLMAMGNTGAALSTLSQPFLVSNIVTKVTDRSQWRIMLFLMAGVIFVSNMLYICFMSTETQPWNDINYQDDKETEEVKK